jgi:hypothetical protein
LFGCAEFNREDEIQQLSLSTDFLVELSDGIFAKVKFYSLIVSKIHVAFVSELGFIFLQRDSMSSFATFSHQAVDFILGESNSPTIPVINPTTNLSYA